MKEKVIIISALTFVFATFYIGKDKISQKSTKVKVNPVSIESSMTTTDSDVIKEDVEMINTENEKLDVSSIDNSQQSTSNACITTEDQIDKLPFSKAFKHYLACQGENTEFNWKGKPYLAELKKKDSKKIESSDPNISPELKSNLAMSKN